MSVNLSPTSRQSVSFSLPHIKLAGIQWGARQDEPIIALHGWLDNAASFEPMIEHLEIDGLLALDFAGHGASEHRPKNSFYHFIDYVDDLHALIMQQGWKKVTFVAHSMGGMVAQIFTAAFPELVNKLVIIESYGLYTGETTDTVQQLKEGMENRRKINLPSTAKSFSLSAGVSARAAAGDLSKQSAMHLVQRSTKLGDDGKYTWRSDRRLKSISLFRFSPEQCTNVLSALNVPTCVIRGKEGYQMIRDNIERYGINKGIVDDVELAGGHHLHMDDPQPTAQQINRFLTFSD